MTTDNRANEQIVAEALCGRRYKPGTLGYLAQTDNQADYRDARSVLAALEAADRLSGTVTEAQVEAAAKAIWERYAGHGLWLTLPDARKSPFLKDARAALVAAQGAAPQSINVEKLLTVIGVALDVTEADVRGEIEASIRREVNHWLAQGDDVVLPSSGVDEEKLSEVLREAEQSWHLSDEKWQQSDACGAPDLKSKYIARAVAEWLKGQEQ